MPIKPIVSLWILFFAALFYGCKKKDTSPAYTDKIGSARHWHGSRFTNAPTIRKSGYYSFADTVFAMTVLDGSTINVGDDTLSYQNSDPLAHSYNFSGHAPWISYSLTYYYDKDSITFHHFVMHATWELQEDYSTN